MSFLALQERLELRRTISSGIRSGQLMPDAGLALYDPDAFSAVEQRVFQAAREALASGWQAPAGSPSHPILAWIVSHAPQILQFVLEILPLFGVPVPPINIPGVPPKPAPKPVGGEQAGDPTQPARHACGMAGRRQEALNVPVWLAPVAEQLAAEALRVILPQLETALEKWVNDHLQGGGKQAA